MTTVENKYPDQVKLVFDEFNYLRGGNINPHIELLHEDDLYSSAMKCVVKGGEEEAILQRQRTNINDLNGTVILGNSPLDKICVLLNNIELKKYFFNGNFTWMGTVFHECTHAMDYYRYAKILNVCSADEVYLSEPHEIFQLWSEFHAKYIGVKKINAAGLAKQDTQEKLGLLNHYWSELIRKTQGSVSSNLYELMQCLGRFKAMEDLNSIVINPFTQSFFKNSTTNIENSAIPQIYKASCEIDICNVSDFMDALFNLKNLLADLYI